MNEKRDIEQTLSEDFIYYCINIIRHDKNISDETLVLMFINYGKKLLQETIKNK